MDGFPASERRQAGECARDDVPGRIDGDAPRTGQALPCVVAERHR
jgi:hypothetical protein